MSLTNYITQSIVGSMLYYNWGFALHNQFGITASCLAGIVFFILQFSFCRWWMNHHSHGPMEYMETGNLVEINPRTEVCRHLFMKTYK